ncbi:MAG TPA: class A beta-lactamase [Bryobacteraceae bacterium]|jgi:beta-lactamase class A|nr:class A beta-lactamase [Bryobacteraceae bacterium]
MRLLFCRLWILGAVFAVNTQARELDAAALQQAFAAAVGGFDGPVGACAQTSKETVCIHADDRFSLQSVVKLAVGVAVLDAVDQGRQRLDDTVIIRTADLSLFVQPLASLVGQSGYQTTIGDLVRRAIIDSDSAATDFLISRLGGPSAIQAVLRAKAIPGLHVDRDERHLQTEIVGLTWSPEYVDAAVLDRAIKAVPRARRQMAYAKYRVDPRDTATPRGMASFLFRLGKGDLLSRASTEYVLRAMRECRTFPDRLKAGVAPAWQIAHKTGTSGSWNGVTAATNDVGILTAPDGSQIAIAVFIADSRKSDAARAAIFARISAAVIANYR